MRIDLCVRPEDLPKVMAMMHARWQSLPDQAARTPSTSCRRGSGGGPGRPKPLVSPGELRDAAPACHPGRARIIAAIVHRAVPNGTFDAPAGDVRHGLSVEEAKPPQQEPGRDQQQDHGDDVAQHAPGARGRAGGPLPGHAMGDGAEPAA